MLEICEAWADISVLCSSTFSHNIAVGALKLVIDIKVMEKGRVVECGLKRQSQGVDIGYVNATSMRTKATVHHVGTQSSSASCAMLMRPNKTETTVYGCWLLSSVLFVFLGSNKVLSLLRLYMAAR